MRENETGAATPAEEVDYSALPVGAGIGRFVVTSILGQGGFGITYRARDEQLGREVAIKEYLPVSLAIRQDGSTVLPRSTKVAEDFTWGRDRFVAEGRTLASLHDAPAIVRVFDFLELNGTAYIVMELVRGETLEDRIKRQGKVSAEEAMAILWPMLDGLEQVHKAGFLHRDIKPANILLREDGRPTLIDFGASRAAMAGRTTAMTAIFTPGYAAAEQMTAAKQGPWTDIYGLAATLYHAITGAPPPPAFDRMLDDDYVPLSKLAPAGFPANLLVGIDAGLAVRATERPQTIAGWRTLLSMTGGVAGDVTQRVATDPAATVMAPRTAPPPPVAAPAPSPSSAPAARSGSKAPLYAGAAAAVLLLAGGGGYLAMRPSAPATPAAAPTSAPQAAVPQLQDMKVEDLERVLAERRAAETAAAEKRKAEEDAKRKADADSAAKVAADAEVAKAEAARQKAEAELAKLKAELEARRLDQETQARKAEAEAAQRKAEIEMAALKAAEDAARRKAEIEAEAKREADKALAKAQEERLKAEKDAQEKAADEAKKKAEATAKQIEEAEKKAKADAEAKAKAAEAETDRKAAEAAETALRLALADRQKVQVALTSLGFDTRGSDGAFGPRSREMITAWQKARNQPVTGFLNGTQHQALLREAAPALQKYDDEQKKKEEEAKKKAEDDAKAKEATAATAPATPPAAGGAGPIPDGAYSGAFNSTMTVNTGGSAINLRVAGTSASGTLSNPRCGTGPINLKLAPTGDVTGEMVWMDATCGRIPLSVQGRASGQQLQLRMSGPGSSGSALLTPGTAAVPAVAAPPPPSPAAPAPAQPAPAQPASAAPSTGGGWSGGGTCSGWGGTLPLQLAPGQTSGRWTGNYGSTVTLTINGNQFSGTIGSKNRSGSKTYTSSFSGTISGGQISAQTVARADFKNNEGPNEMHCTVNLTAR
ncbi:MAG: protein kinase [Proteobacteria bacterium]|nr:protein kinase [Pseudomonadota bacterium]